MCFTNSDLSRSSYYSSHRFSSYHLRRFSCHSESVGVRSLRREVEGGWVYSNSFDCDESMYLTIRDVFKLLFEFCFLIAFAVVKGFWIGTVVVRGH